MEPAESTELITDSRAESDADDSVRDGGPQCETDLASLLDGFEFASCVARLERHWPTAKVPSNVAPVLQRLGKFEIRKELGRGRFGVVFLAWDNQLQRQVALKVPQFDAALDPELRERFRGEALAAAKLQHPGIVGLYEVGQHAGVDYLAMAYIEGSTLAQRLKMGPLPAREAALVVSQLAHAVHHAHDHGVIHRDLKPSNVLLDLKGEPHVMDFGLARRLSDSAMRATATGQVLGTPAYMPPEQATGQSDIRATSDVYSLGVILYETLTGHPPFQAATFLEAVEFILNREPIPPSKLNPKLPRELDAIVAKCLEKSPSARYASAAELAADLENYLEGRPIRAKAQGPVRRAMRWCQKHPSRALLLVASCVAFALLVATTSIYSRWQRAREVAVQQLRIANAERYYSTVHRARSVISRRGPGWSPAALREIEAAAANKMVADRGELRALASECWNGFDLEREATLAPGISIGRIAISPDGRLLAVGELKGTAYCQVLIYEVATRQLKHTFTLLNVSKTWERFGSGHDKKFQDGVRELAFSSDGRYLAAGMRFGAVQVFDLSQPNDWPRKLPLAEDLEFVRMAFSADGNQLFGLTKREYQFLHWSDWRQKAEFDKPWPEPQLSFAASVKGDRIFAQAHARNKIKILDQKLQAQGDYSHLAPLPRGTEGSLATDQTGRLLAGESDHGLCVYNAETGELIRRLPDDSPTANGIADELAMTHDGKLLSAFDFGGAVRLFDVSAGRQVMNLVLGRSDSQYVALDPKGLRLVVADGGMLEFWRIQRSRCRSVLNHPADELLDVQFAPRNATLHAAGNVGSIHSQLRSTLLNYAGSSLEPQQRLDCGFHRVYFSPNGAQVAWSPDGRHAVWVGSFGALHYEANTAGKLTYLGPVPLTGPVHTTSIENVNEDQKGVSNQLELRDCDTVKGGRALQVRDAQSPIAIQLSLADEITLTDQKPVLLVSLQITGHNAYRPPFTYSTQIEGQQPTKEVSPDWLVANPEGGFQQWAISLNAPAGAWNEIRLQLNPAAHVDDLQIERADLVLLGTNDPEPSYPSTQVVEQLTFGQDGKTLWAQVDDTVRSWTWPEVRPLVNWLNPQHSLTGAANVRAIAATPTGLLVGSRNGYVISLAPESDSERDIWKGPGNEVTTLVTCAEARLALAGADNGIVRAFSVPEGKILFDVPAAAEAIMALAATPDAEWMVTATIDRQLQWWRRSAAGFELYCQLPDTTSVVRALELSPDGQRLAVLSRNTATLELWDLGKLKDEFQRLDIQ